MATASALPRWNMSVVYPSLESPEFAQAFQGVADQVDALGKLFDELGVGERANAAVDDPTTRAVETAIDRLNELLDHVRTVTAYISAFVSTNTRDNVAQAKYSELQQHSVQLSKLTTRFAAWIGSMDVEALIARSPLASAHAHMLQQTKIRATHLMAPAEEALAAELNVSGGSAWGKLHSNMTSQVSVPVELGEETRVLPMSAVRNLAFEADRQVRRRGYEAELRGWETVTVPLAAALNSIKGQVNTLSKRRNWETPLDEALFGASIDRQTLDAMMTAAHESFPDFRRYFAAKARALGVPKMAWYDIFAPVGASERSWEFAESAQFVITQFDTFSQRLGDFAARAFRERWIDAEPRPGKQDGAYCMSLRGDESRVFANFKPVYGGMSTLAHELGHGYHNLNLAQRTMLQHSTPMTLAETASIFCETIVRHAALGAADAQEQLLIVEASLQDSTQVVVDITSRFLFEQRVFEKRRDRELSVDELKELMLQAQRETYGDGLDASLLHPYMWAVKGHYYSAGRSFYNFPYMFGLLFGLGLYAEFQRDPERFAGRYDDLLASTGMDDAATLAQRFEIDIRTPAFWRASLDVVRGDIARFETLVG